MTILMHISYSKILSTALPILAIAIALFSTAAGSALHAQEITASVRYVRLVESDEAGVANSAGAISSSSSDTFYVVGGSEDPPRNALHLPLIIRTSEDPKPLVAPTNETPHVDAGPDQSVTLPAAAALDGTVTDDGLPNPPGLLATTWSVVSGAGTVTFTNASLVDTTASFSADGAYVLMLTANDGELSASAQVTITVDSQITNQAPFVDAGPDQSVTLPAAAALDGTVTDDGLPNPPGLLATTWSVVSGAGTVTFTNASLVDTTASFSADGAYVLMLTANDGELSASAQVTITVDSQVTNQAPFVDAGPDQSVTLPAAAALDGTVTDDGLPNPPGLLATMWSVVSGAGTVTFTNASLVDTTASFSADGAYVLMLTANDGELSASAQVTITVDSQVTNQAPFVDAGPDQSVTLPAAAALDGTVTDDGLPNPPGLLATTWSVVSGAGTVTFTNASLVDTTASFSADGAYVLMLTANDGELSASAQVTITVDSQVTNQAPFVDAGPDQSVTLPAAAALDGTVTDDGLPNPPGLLATTWSVVSGAGTVTFTNASLVDTTASFSADGAYVLMLTANDGELSASAQVTITVDSQITNQAPFVDAGPDQSVTLPAAAALDGTVTDDGLPNPPGLLATTWSVVSGAGTVTFTNASLVDTTASFSADGAYVLMLTANDGELSASAQVTITVNSPLQMTLDVRVATDSDDAEENASGSVALGSSDLELVLESDIQTVGIRFNGLAIPRGATISNAHIQFQADETSTDSTSLTIHGEAVDNAVTFASVNGNISSRPRTNAAEVWSPAPWATKGEAGPDQRTPDIKSVIQEIVNQPGWACGNSLAIIISGDGKRVAESFDGLPHAAPLLYVDFEAPGGNKLPTVTITAPTDGLSFSQGVPVTFAGTASDEEDGDLTSSLTWTSDLDGTIGTGASFTKSDLSEGTHMVRATVSDSAGLCVQDTVYVTTATSSVLVGAGDIAGCGSQKDEETALLLDNIAGTVFTVGDNVYPDATDLEFSNCYDPTWGRHKDRTRPTPGNHDYHTQGASGYFNYFGAAAGAPDKGYYSYDVGAWHIIAINSQCAEVGGCDTNSPQWQWLQADLAANSSACTLAYWHHPLFSSGANHGGAPRSQDLWQLLYDAGADVVLNGHEHNYERFAPQNPSGSLDTARGIRQFVVGMGGAGLYPFGPAEPNSEVREGNTHGVLKLTLHPTSYDWEFIPIAGQTFTDSGSATCVP